jgi:hypothetical protein
MNVGFIWLFQMAEGHRVVEDWGDEPLVRKEDIQISNPIWARRSSNNIDCISACDNIVQLLQDAPLRLMYNNYRAYHGAYIYFPRLFLPVLILHVHVHCTCIFSYWAARLHVAKHSISEIPHHVGNPIIEHNVNSCRQTVDG